MPGWCKPCGCFITGHDAKTGAELWRVYAIAHPGDPNFDTGTACRWKAGSAPRR
jgi:hypothetical protein